MPSYLQPPPPPSTGADPKQMVAGSNVPSTQTGFSVKESFAQNELSHCCVKGEDKWSMGLQEKEGKERWGVTGV